MNPIKNGADILALIDNAVPESRFLEYKRDLPDASRESKKEFTKDVSAFANEHGGVLIFGIEEDNGVPVQITGVPTASLDQDQTRLNQILADGIVPRIFGLDMFPVHLDDGRAVIVIRIPRSVHGPHMVVSGDDHRFYKRHATGKIRMDVMDLRIAFGLSGERAETIRAFRDTRVKEISRNEGRLLPDLPAVLLQLIPMSAFEPGVRHDLNRFASNPLLPIGAGGANPRFNFEGFLVVDSIQSDKARSYLQIFQNGIFESAVCDIGGQSQDGLTKYLWPASFEGDVLKALPQYLKEMEAIGVQPPIYVFLSLIHVSGWQIVLDSYRRHQRSIEKNELRPSEALLESFGVDVYDLLRPVYDDIWRAAGWQRSFNYDENGKWTGKHCR